MTKTTIEKYRKISQENIEDGCFCILCEMSFAEAYGRPLACEGCGGDGVLDERAVADKKYCDRVNEGYLRAKDGCQ